MAGRWTGTNATKNPLWARGTILHTIPHTVVTACRYVHPNSKTNECTLQRGGHYTDTALEQAWRDATTATATQGGEAAANQAEMATDE